MDIWEIIDKYPPCVVRIFAREPTAGKRIRAVSNDEIAVSSGLPVERVKQIAFSSSWNHIKVGEMRAFIKGCGFDPLDSSVRNRVKAYCRRDSGVKFKYLITSPWWKTELKPLIKKMENDKISLNLQ
jgi:hypothetical protein